MGHIPKLVHMKVLFRCGRVVFEEKNAASQRQTCSQCFEVPIQVRGLAGALRKFAYDYGSRRKLRDKKNGP